VILAGTIYPNLLKRMQSIQVPFVALSNNVVGVEGKHAFDQVGFDDFHATLDATRYLISEGHREIAFAGDTSFPWFQRRFNGYQQAIREKRLKSIQISDHNAENFIACGQKIAQRILSRKPRPTAVIAGNDETAYGIWLSLRRNAVKMPNEISLVGFDDREEAILMDPPLTTVRVHKEEIGHACMKMLLERLHNPGMTYSQRILPTEFVIRGSVKNLRS
jgi:LacI family transcriptional regulator